LADSLLVANPRELSGTSVDAERPDSCCALPPISLSLGCLRPPQPVL